MYQALAPYIDLYARTPQTRTSHARAGAQARPHIGQVHTWLVSAHADGLLMHFDMAAAKDHLHGGIVVNVGGYMGYALTAMTGARKLLNVDLNALQAVHHKQFAQYALADSNNMDGFWHGVERAEAATNTFWHDELNSCWLTGYAAREITRRESFRRLKAPLRDVLQGLGYAESEVCGLSEQAVAHNRTLARAGDIHTAVVDLGCPHQMRQLGAYIDVLACQLGGAPGADGARRVPVVVYGCNAVDFMVDYMGGNMDFCGMPSSHQRWQQARQSMQDMVFGERGQHRGTLISVKSDEYGTLLSQDAHTSPRIDAAPRPPKPPEPEQLELVF